MVEKKFLIEDKPLAYDGPFELAKFYDVIEKWIEQKGKEKEIKMKREHVEKDHKKIEWNIEIWEDVADDYRSVIRLRSLFQHLTEAPVQQGKSKKTMQNASVLLNFDGILETDLDAKWETKPMYFFFQWIFERYIYKARQNKYEPQIAADLQNLYDTLHQFFSSYKVQQKV